MLPGHNEPQGPSCAWISPFSILYGMFCTTYDDVYHHRESTIDCVIRNSSMRQTTIMEFSQLFPLLQFTDSAFPTGGFSHSQGIEAFIQHYHHVGTRKDHNKLFNAFICILENSGSLHLPFVRAAHAVFQDLTTQAAEAGEPPTCSVQSKNGESHSPANELNQSSGNGCSELVVNKCTELTNNQCSTDRLQSSLRQLVELDKTFEACSTNHISRRASARQGKSFIEVLKLIYKDLYLDLMSALSELPHGHYPVVYGAVMSVIGVDSDAALGSFMFCVVRGLITSAVRLDVLGAMEGQKLQCNLQQTIADIVTRNKLKAIGCVSTRFPLVDVLQNTQDTLFCKLFYS